MNSDDLKRKIFDILYKYSSDLKIKSGILEEPEIEEWLWSGDFDLVVTDIVKETDAYYYKNFKSVINERR